MKNFSSRLYAGFVLLAASLQTFARAGFADRLEDYRNWIFPAYEYCLVFGFVILVALFIITVVCKARTQATITSLCSALSGNKLLAIAVLGPLMAIPLGILICFLGEALLYLAALPLLGIFGFFPIVLLVREFRTKWLLSPFLLKWTLMISLSTVLASLLFIILTNCHVLPGTDITILSRARGFMGENAILSHPYDSMKSIWQFPLVFIGESFVVLIIAIIGDVCRWVWCKLTSDVHNCCHFKRL